MPIALFVATGFEHSVANIFMIPLGILISDTAGAGFWSDAKTDASSYSGLTWDSFLVDNLLPVTLGNIVGGGVMIGVMYEDRLVFEAVGQRDARVVGLQGRPPGPANSENREGADTPGRRCSVRNSLRARP
jgi:hypothetical protein